MQNRGGHDGAARVFEGHGHLVFGARAGVENGCFADGSDGASGFFEIFDIEASDNKAGVVGHGVGQGNVASDFGEVDQGYGVDAVEMIADGAAVGHLHFAVAGAQDGNVGADGASVWSHAAEQHGEHVFAARQHGQHVPGFADQVAIAIEVGAE